jgi:YD repeat-containing protein
MVSSVATYGYDADGEKTSETDPDDNTTYFSYDSYGRLASQSGKGKRGQNYLSLDRTGASKGKRGQNYLSLDRTGASG